MRKNPWLFADGKCIQPLATIRQVQKESVLMWSRSTVEKKRKEDPRACSTCTARNTSSKRQCWLQSGTQPFHTPPASILCETCCDAFVLFCTHLIQPSCFTAHAKPCLFCRRCFVCFLASALPHAISPFDTTAIPQEYITLCLSLVLWNPIFFFLTRCRKVHTPHPSTYSISISRNRTR